MINKGEFDRLVDQAWNHEFSGWDFSYIAHRMLETQPSWDYRQIVLQRMVQVSSLLDLDTGGGKLLSTLVPLPPITCATEGYAPNIPIAKARLEPLGVQVFATQAMTQLPFSDNTFDLVINRHGGFLASEIHRILKPQSCFITQQVGGKNCLRLNEFLQDEVYFEYAYWTLEYAVQELQADGFDIIDQRDELQPTEFLDIGALVYHLKAISWQVNDFSIDKYYSKLARIHNIIQETGKFVVYNHRFYIEAQKR